MGILDDAIREHLDLKRRQGADQDELARLEDEAFGPPTRPGDPERGADGEGAASPEGDGAAGNGSEATATEIPAFLDQEAATEAGEPTVEDTEDTEEPEAAAPDEALALPAEPTVEHDTLGAEEESKEIDLDIDLDLDEEIEDIDELDEAELEEATRPDSGETEPSGAADEPIESLDTVEHHFEDAIDEAEVVEDEPEGQGEDSEDEDVLEETPEFLRDAPEDDELWFEQGEPKDFDF